MVEPKSKKRKLIKTIRAWFSKRSDRIAIWFLVVSIMVLLLWPYCTKIIPTGNVGVFYRIWGGTVTDRYFGEGLHVFLPWNRMFVYDCRVQRQDFSVTALSQGGLKIDVELSTIYNVIKKEAPGLHFRVGLDYAQKLIVPGATFAVRGVVGNLHQSEIYNKNPLKIQGSVFELLDEMLQQEDTAINLHGVFVRKIVLPDKMKDAIESKHVAEQRVYQERYKILETYERYKRVYLEANTVRMAQKLINQGLTQEYLRYIGIKATRELATSPNAKLVLIGGKDGLPLLLNPDSLHSGEPGKPTAKLGPTLSSETQPPIDVSTLDMPALSVLEENLEKLDDILGDADDADKDKVLTTLPKHLLEKNDFYQQNIDLTDKTNETPLQKAGPDGFQGKTTNNQRKGNL